MTLNKILTKILLLAILGNGCVALALVDEYHHMRAGNERIAEAIPSQTLHELPTPAKHRKAVRS